MIKSKPCNAPNCLLPRFSGGYCKRHGYLKVSKPKREPVDRNLFKREVKAPENNYDLNKWFEEKMKSDHICENCGKSLAGLNNFEWRASQHHILEKSKFDSLKAHPLNHLVLGFYCCHGQWHTSMLNASKMPIFSKAKKIVLELLPLIPKDEIKHVSSYYLS